MFSKDVSEAPQTFWEKINISLNFGQKKTTVWPLFNFSNQTISNIIYVRKRRVETYILMYNKKSLIKINPVLIPVFPSPNAGWAIFGHEGFFFIFDLIVAIVEVYGLLSVRHFRPNFNLQLTNFYKNINYKNLLKNFLQSQTLFSKRPGIGIYSGNLLK